MENYDSTADTLKHIKRVNELLLMFCKDLMDRAADHDKSKLASPEKEIFDEWTPKLAATTYGTPEYFEMLGKLKPALENHYANNSHHPEHYPDGIDGMTLGDLVEMFFDWKAASERHKDGDIEDSIKKNAKRFNMSPQLEKIFLNTVIDYFFEAKFQPW